LASTSKKPPQLGRPRRQRGGGGGDLVQVFGFHGVSSGERRGL